MTSAAIGPGVLVDRDVVLSLRNLRVRFGGNTVLHDLDLDIGTGFTGLLGPNGAGKTTIFNAVTGYVTPQAGTVALRGNDISGLRATVVAKRGIARTFQTPRLVLDLPVFANVLLGLDGRGVLRGRAAKGRTTEIIDAFGLGDLARKQAGDVPLASQKVVEVARAFVSGPTLVLLDEPAAGLSVADVDALVVPLREVALASGTTVCIIEHDVELVARLCERVAILHLGRALAAGPPDVVLARADVLDAYLGAGFAAFNS